MTGIRVNPVISHTEFPRNDFRFALVRVLPSAAHSQLIRDYRDLAREKGFKITDVVAGIGTVQWFSKAAHIASGIDGTFVRQLPTLLSKIGCTMDDLVRKRGYSSFIEYIRHHALQALSASLATDDRLTDCLRIFLSTVGVLGDVQDSAKIHVIDGRIILTTDNAFFELQLQVRRWEEQNSTT